jgi:hypothetical protein
MRDLAQARERMCGVGHAACDKAGEASLAWGVLLADVTLRRKRRRAAALHMGLGSLCLAGVFEGYVVDAAEV